MTLNALEGHSLLQAFSSAIVHICGASRGPSPSAELLIVITSANVDRFSKFLHSQFPKEILYAVATMMSTSTLPELRCYTTLPNLKIQNSCVSKTTPLSFHHFFFKY